MKVFHLSAECYPVAKVGGLADVVGALPKYQVKAGIQAAVAMPFYNRKFVQQNEFDIVFYGVTALGEKEYDFEIWKEKKNVLGFELYLVKIPGLIDRENIYSYPDETQQFIAYQLTFLNWIKTQPLPDIIHCHDHHSGLVPFLIAHAPEYSRLSKIQTVFTIHNGQYHGAFGWEKFSYLPEVDDTQLGLLDWSGGINPLASAIKCCSLYTTVSPSYMEELSWNSNGLESLFQVESAKGVGIVNGIDVQVWDPKTDEMIAGKYNKASALSGKRKNKEALCERFKLSVDLPLISFIGRLVTEKGADLLAAAIARSIAQHHGEVNFLILGTGDPETELELLKLRDVTPDYYRTYIGYDETLSHLIYAGSDFLLMPSRVEPCGLNQLYALRYGTVPMVRSTGGLKDTVVDFGDPGGYGIRFEQPSVADICQSVDRAIVLYQDNNTFLKIRKTMMELDFSWDKSAKQYSDLYESLTLNI